MVVRLASLILVALISGAQAMPLLVDESRISALRSNSRLVTTFLKKCDKELAEPSHAVVDFAPAPHYTAQGTNPDDVQAKGLTGDIRRAYRAALCYRLSGNTAYAAKTQNIADAWARAMKTASTAQGRGDINFNIAQLIVAASWVDGTNDWNSGSFKKWLNSVIAPLSLSSEPNNRGTWGNLQDLAIAGYLEDPSAFEKANRRWQELVTSQIAEDGTLPLEICRSNSSNHCDGPDKGINGLAYTHYALLPITLAGSILQQSGRPAFSAEPAATRLAAAYRKTLGFTLHLETFPYYASNGGKLNKVNYCGYFPLLRVSLTKAKASVLPPERQLTCAGDYWFLQTLFAN